MSTVKLGFPMKSVEVSFGHGGEDYGKVGKAYVEAVNRAGRFLLVWGNELHSMKAKEGNIAEIHGDTYLLVDEFTGLLFYRECSEETRKVQEALKQYIIAA
jgi:hypothetical protein